MGADGLSQRRADAAAFVVAGCAFSLQVLAHRVVSAKLLNNYAFLVIALTMLGFALSGVLLTGPLRIAQQRLGEFVSACTSAAVLTAIGAVAFLYRFHAGPQFAASRPEFVVNF